MIKTIQTLLISIASIATVILMGASYAGENVQSESETAEIINPQPVVPASDYEKLKKEVAAINTKIAVIEKLIDSKENRLSLWVTVFMAIVAIFGLAVPFLLYRHFKEVKVAAKEMKDDFKDIGLDAEKTAKEAKTNLEKIEQDAEKTAKEARANLEKIEKEARETAKESKANLREIEKDARETARDSKVNLKEIEQKAEDYLKTIKEREQESQDVVKKAKVGLENLTYSLMAIEGNESEAPPISFNTQQLKGKIQSEAKNKTLDSIEIAIVEAAKLQQDGKYQKAFDKWLAIAEISREDDKEAAARAYFSAAYLLGEYVDKGNHEERINLYTKAIKLKPDFEIAFYNRGNAYDDMGKHKEAITDYTQAIKLKPDYENALYNRGLSYRKMGKCEEAIADFTQAIKLKPDYADAFNNCGAAYGDMGKHKEAITNFTQAIKLKPNYPTAYANRGTVYYSMGEYEKALADLNKALELNPDPEIADYARTAIAEIKQEIQEEKGQE